MKGKGARTNIGFNKKYFPHSFGIFFYGCVGCIECAFVGFSRTNAGKYRGKSTFTFTQFSCYSVGSINSWLQKGIILMFFLGWAVLLLKFFMFPFHFPLTYREIFRFQKKYSYEKGKCRPVLCRLLYCSDVKNPENILCIFGKCLKNYWCEKRKSGKKLRNKWKNSLSMKGGINFYSGNFIILNVILGCGKLSEKFSRKMSIFFFFWQLWKAAIIVKKAVNFLLVYFWWNYVSFLFCSKSEIYWSGKWNCGLR